MLPEVLLHFEPIGGRLAVRWEPIARIVAVAISRLLKVTILLTLTLVITPGATLVDYPASDLADILISSPGSYSQACMATALRVLPGREWAVVLSPALIR
jgi:hypothetical protein